MPFFKGFRATKPYECSDCKSRIREGDFYYRSETYPRGREKPRSPLILICRKCFGADDQEDLVFTDQLLIPFNEDMRSTPQIAFIDTSKELINSLKDDWNRIYTLSEDAFENLVLERLSAMNYGVLKTGRTNRKDGGIDILFWSKSAIPLIGAAQVKLHRNQRKNTGPAAVREMVGVVNNHRLNAGIVVTNTSFTPDAKWVAKQMPYLIRLHDGKDLCNWIRDNFAEDAKFQSMPRTLELCPGVVIELPFTSS